MSQKHRFLEKKKYIYIIIVFTCSEVSGWPRFESLKQYSKLCTRIC